MKWHGNKAQIMHHDMHHSRCIGGLFVISMVLSGLAGVWMTFKLVRTLEVMALVNTLEKLDGRLTEAERTDLEHRVRDILFS